MGPGVMISSRGQRIDVSERRPDLPLAASGGERQELVHLQGPALVANSGVALNVDWVDSVRINTSAVERRGGFGRLSGRAQPIPGATRRGAAFGRGGRA